MALARLFDFTDGTTILSAQVDAELNQIVAALNGTSVIDVSIRHNHATTPPLTVNATGGSPVTSFKVSGVEKSKINAAGQYESTVVTGTAPMAVASTTQVANLNADMVDGKHVADLLLDIDPSIAVGGDSNSELTFERAAGGVVKLENQANDFVVLNTTTAQTLLALVKASGIATFLSQVRTSAAAPAAANDLTRKDYVDSGDVAAAAAGGVLGTTVSGLSGGTNGKVVRQSAGTVWTDASNTDNNDHLMFLLFKSGGSYYKPGSVVPGLSGVGAGTVYWLGTAGNLITTAPPPTPTLRQVPIGVGLSTTSIYFYPGRPIGAE